MRRSAGSFRVDPKRRGDCVHTTDPEFERPERIIGLARAGCEIPSIDLLTTPNDSIFKLNWTTQTFVRRGLPIPKRLWTLLHKKANDLLATETETNHFAVAFEGLAFAYSSYPASLTTLFELFFMLEHRTSCHNTVYAFLDGTARMDITTHVFNGLVALLG